MLHRLHDLLHFLQASSSCLLHSFEQMSHITAQRSQILSAYLLFLDMNRTAMLQISEQSRHALIHPAILVALPTRHDVIQASQVSTQSLQVLIHLSKVKILFPHFPKIMTHQEPDSFVRTILQWTEHV